MPKNYAFWYLPQNFSAATLYSSFVLKLCFLQRLLPKNVVYVQDVTHITYSVSKIIVIAVKWEMF